LHKKRTGLFFLSVSIPQDASTGQVASDIYNWNAGKNIELGLAAVLTGELNNTQNPEVTLLSRVQKVVHEIESFVQRHREC
jgi:hypothetical protein